jgi:tetratricopeptide (TPR) repeat protein
MPIKLRRMSVLVIMMALVGCDKSSEVSRLTFEASQAQARGDYETAITRWTSALQLDPKNSQGYLARAALYESTGKWDKAVADYTENLRRPAASSAMYRRLGLKADQAEQQTLSAERAAIFCRRGFVYSKKGDFDKAINDLNEAFQLNPRDPTAYASLAQIYDMKGDSEKALRSLTKAIEVAPKDPTGYVYRGLFYSKRGKYDEALADLNEALRLAPENAQALMHRAIAYSRHGEFDNALDDLDGAVRADPENPEIYAARGALHLDTGKFDEAFQDLNHSLLLRPKDPVALARRGLALSKRGDLEHALADLNEAIRLNPSEAMFYAWRGSVHSATNRFDKALEDFDHALQLNATEPVFHSLRGFVYSKQGQFGQAVADFKKAMLLNPGSPEAYNNLAWVRATCPDASFRNGKEALQLALQGCELTGFKYRPLIDTLAAAYAETGDFEQAIKYEKQSFDLVGVTDKNRPGMQQRLALYERHLPYRQAPDK